MNSFRVSHSSSSADFLQEQEAGDCGEWTVVSRKKTKDSTTPLHSPKQVPTTGSASASSSSSSPTSSRARPSRKPFDLTAAIANANAGNAKEQELTQAECALLKAKAIQAEISSGQQADLQRLGAGLDYKNRYAYGKMTEPLKEAALSFFEAFFTADNIALVKAHQNQRFSLGKRRPPCIAFASLQLLNPKTKASTSCCLISISRPNNRSADTTVIDALRINTQDLQSFSGMRFFLVSHCSAVFNAMILEGHGKEIEQKEKTCAEKVMFSCLEKLLQEFGENLTITGFLTATLYPYEASKIALGSAEPYEGIVEQPHAREEQLILEKGGLYISLIPPCLQCQTNKVSHFHSLRLAQKTPQEEEAIQTPQPLNIRRATSNPSEADGEKAPLQYLLDWNRAQERTRAECRAPSFAALVKTATPQPKTSEQAKMAMKF